MGYSKESERQNKVLGDLLAGRTPEKRVMVGYEGKKQSSGDQISRMTDIMKDVRMPMFCPECDKIMKKRLDDKFWMMFGHCFDCQITIENKLRISDESTEILPAARSTPYPPAKCERTLSTLGPV